MRYRLKPNNYRRPDRDLLNDLRRVARALGTRRLTDRQYQRLGRFHPCTIIRRFGGWSAGVRRAGLRAKLYRRSEEDLFLNFRTLWRCLGRPPVRNDLCRRPSTISYTPYVRRYGTFGQARIAFVKWVRSDAGRRSIRRADRLAAKHQPRSRTARNRFTRRAPLPIVGMRAMPRPCRVRRVSVSQRFRVLQRDRYRCRACGRSPANDLAVELHVDHITPVAKGGSDSLRNLQTLCEQCNYGKGARRLTKPLPRRSTRGVAQHAGSDSRDGAKT